MIVTCLIDTSPMIRLTELKLTLDQLPLAQRRASDAPAETQADRAGVPHPLAALRQLARQKLGISESDIAGLSVFKRSFDARKSDLAVVYIVDLSLYSSALEARLLQQYDKDPHVLAAPDMHYALQHRQLPAGMSRPLVVGFGPCGIFAALLLAQMGLRPIVIERGKSVRQRTKDTWGLWRRHQLQAESNVQFGEGGAGTFSDGKLYSQIKDPRHLGRKVMQELVDAGAPANILFEAHPHIGTFKLVRVVESLRQRIEALGGDILFEHRLSDILIEQRRGKRQLRGVTVVNQAKDEAMQWEVSHMVLALGHSARDTFAMLHRHGVAMYAKPLSVGFRIEHPQSMIDRARWGRLAGHPQLGAADYKLVHHASNGRSVYSFCMCPGGTVVAATSEVGRVVTNGMSQYSRNERNANAGMVVGIDPQDFAQDEHAFTQAFGADEGAGYAEQAAQMRAMHATAVHPLSGINLQRVLESHAFVLGGASYEAPGQLVGDFLAGRASSTLGSVQPSYQPGVLLTDLSRSLPDYAILAMREALPAFGKKLRGFDMPDAVLTGVETRTSSPLRIVRNEAMQSTNTDGLFPGGEGAGYAGGILSAGVDGIKLAEAVGQSMARASPKLNAPDGR